MESEQITNLIGAIEWAGWAIIWPAFVQAVFNK